MHRFLSVLVLVMLAALQLEAASQQPGGQVQDLKTLSLEELMQIDVTTVSREPERRIDAPAAVSVITGEDIRRYGVDTLADALRLADSVSVARFNGGSWAIATRGFSATTNNKLLVMIDGRSVYTPLFGGVFWEAQHVPLPDLDRIEIIRGPAGTLWGPNAVNGVINIITKRTADTQGVIVRGVTGSRETGHLIGRYGGQINPRTSYRVYGVGSEFDSPQLQDGTSAREDRQLLQAGGRIEWELDGQAHLTVQGDVNSGRVGLQNRSDIEMDGGNVVVTYTKPLGAGESLQILGYADREHREVPQQSWENRSTYNVEGQHTIRFTPRYNLIWGGGVLDIEPDETHGGDLLRARRSHHQPGARVRANRHHPAAAADGHARDARRADDVQRFRAAPCGAGEVHAQDRHLDLGRHFPRGAHPHAVRPGTARGDQRRRRHSRR